MRIGAAGPGDEPNAIGAAMSAASAAEELPAPALIVAFGSSRECSPQAGGSCIFHPALARNTIHEHPQRDTRDQ